VWRVATKPDFSLDLEAIDAAINSKTKVVLINSPNNPTGQVYDQDSIEALATLLALRSSELGQPIFLVSDEPYRKVVFDGVTVPSIMALYPNSFVANSYSKSLSLSGERLGYIAVNPRIVQPEFILDGLFIANRILGFINAPALMQRVIAEVPDACVDINKYQARRDFMSLRLGTIGYEIPEPGGTFYMFPKSPIGDDVHFVRMLLQENILAVPSTGFGIPGYFRLALCLDQKTMKRSLAGFIRAWKACRG
jgi:aspartate aminotransferase